MSRKTIKRTKAPLSPRPVEKQPDTIFLVREELDEPQEQPAKAAAAGAAAEPVVAPTPVVSKPLAPLAAIWPDAAPAKEESRPTPAPSQQAQQTPAAAAKPKPPPAPAPASPNPPARPAPFSSPEQPAGLAQAPKPTSAKTVNVSFALLEPDAKQVLVCGDFNAWSPTATPMKRDKSGHWETTVALAPGRYQYKFVVDGHWIPDPLARENLWNDRGTLNSVVEVS